MNTKRIKELAALTDGELARKLLIQEFGNDSETHWGNNAHDERVMVTINPDGIAQRTWEADHWVRLDEFDKDGFYAREIYEGKWVDEPLPKNVIARNAQLLHRNLFSRNPKTLKFFEQHKSCASS